MLEIIEEIEDEFATIIFRCNRIEPPKEYDGDGPSPVLSIQICRNEKSSEVWLAKDLIAAIRTVDLNPSTYAAKAPETLARTVTYLEDSGRLVRDHPLYMEFLQNKVDDINSLLPRFENETLTWNVVTLDHNGETTIEERKMHIV